MPCLTRGKQPGLAWSMLGELVAVVLERALQAELAAHLGYEKHDRMARRPRRRARHRERRG
jgi:transposase-like protein